MTMTVCDRFIQVWLASSGDKGFWYQVLGTMMNEAYYNLSDSFNRFSTLTLKVLGSRLFGEIGKFRDIILKRLHTRAK